MSDAPDVIERAAVLDWKESVVHRYLAEFGPSYSRVSLSVVSSGGEFYWQAERKRDRLLSRARDIIAEASADNDWNAAHDWLRQYGAFRHTLAALPTAEPTRGTTVSLWCCGRTGFVYSRSGTCECCGLGRPYSIPQQLSPMQPHDAPPKGGEVTVGLHRPLETTTDEREPR